MPGHIYSFTYFTLGGAVVAPNSLPAGGASSYEVTFDVTPPPEITSVTHPSNRDFVIIGQALPFSPIEIQSSPDPGAPFVMIGETVSDANGAFQYDDADAGNLPRRFYRASYSSP
jgi:hypothetical protein